MIKIKKIKNILNAQDGFSLIELMVVVAIIGVLMAIAVPNFLNFQAKAKQSEAKGNLVGYYQAAKATFAEYGHYPGNFVAIAFAPEGNLYYRITSVNGVIPPGLSPSEDQCISTNSSCTTAGYIKGSNWTENASVSDPVGCNAATGDSSFITCASGIIFPDGDNTLIDTWSINEKKELKYLTGNI